MQANISIENVGKQTIELIEAAASDYSVVVSQWKRSDDGTRADATFTGAFPNVGELVGWMESNSMCFTLRLVGDEYSTGT